MLVMNQKQLNIYYTHEHLFHEMLYAILIENVLEIRLYNLENHTNKTKKFDQSIVSHGNFL